MLRREEEYPGVIFCEKFKFELLLVDFFSQYFFRDFLSYICGFILNKEYCSIITHRDTFLEN